MPTGQERGSKTLLFQPRFEDLKLNLGVGCPHWNNKETDYSRGRLLGPRGRGRGRLVC